MWFIASHDVTQWRSFIVGKERRIKKNKKGDVSGSAVSILIICFWTVNNKPNSIMGVQC